jgi:hypothetical protein
VVKAPANKFTGTWGAQAKYFWEDGAFIYLTATPRHVVGLNMGDFGFVGSEFSLEPAAGAAG